MMNEKRFDFLGVNISVTSPEHAFKKITEYSFTRPAYICFPDAYVIKEANDDPALTSILNASFLTMPDGKPSQLVARLQGYRSVTTVSGYHLCNALLQTEHTHYFYGANEEMITSLQENLRQKHPKARIMGFKSPPFVDAKNIAGNEQIIADINNINALKPDLVWIGISSPKQDYLMHHFYQHLDKSLMLGVGGAFLYFSDQSLKSPEFIKKMGLRWAYRLLKEPGRLWPKYYGTFKFLFRNRGYFIKSFFSSRI